MVTLKNGLNLSMLCDFYEMTMGNGYLTEGMSDRIAYFDLYFRKVPDGGGVAIAMGLRQVVEYLEELKFDEEDIRFLREQNLFQEAFLSYLKDFTFSCDIWAMPEGTPVFPGEPLMTVRGPVIQAQLIETMLLLIVNHQSVVATKANRIVRAAQGREVVEFGARRAHGSAAAIYGARAAYIAGCVGTSCTASAQAFGILPLGTMAHSWVQMFDSELEAFRTYARNYPANCMLLVDTYSVLKTGIPNAIKVFNEEVLPQGHRPLGVRIDSGDLTYLSKKARKMLDEAGFPDAKIMVSNSLDEYIIQDLLTQGACIDQFGVGERMITAKSDPVFGGVYKLVAVEDGGVIYPKIKISEDVSKITTPHFKKVYRLFGTENKAIADVVCLHDERIEDNVPYKLFDPDFPFKSKIVHEFHAEELLKPIFEKGKLVYELPTIEQSRDYCLAEIERLWDEVLRFENPHNYYVDLSLKLWEAKQSMIHEQVQ